VIPGLTGLTGDAYHDPAVLASGFRAAMRIGAALAAAGGVLAWVLIRNDATRRVDSPPTGRLDRCHYCPVDGPPLATERDASAATRPAA
jgi:hypothetical protein